MRSPLPDNSVCKRNAMPIFQWQRIDIEIRWKHLFFLQILLKGEKSRGSFYDIFSRQWFLLVYDTKKTLGVILSHTNHAIGVCNNGKVKYKNKTHDCQQCARTEGTSNPLVRNLTGCSLLNNGRNLYNGIAKQLAKYQSERSMYVSPIHPIIGNQ